MIVAQWSVMLLSWCEWLYSTELSATIRESLWVYPMLHFWHILANTFMFGTIVFLDLRLIGVGFAKRRVTDIAAQILPWTWFGWAMMFLSGGLIFASDPVRYYGNTYFRIKFALMALAGVNALLFHTTFFKTVARWDEGAVPGRARMAGLVSLVSWVLIVFAGRAVGYFE
ncbi:MAG: hypothetical protein RL328_1614 [Acidobacteriota bacterium]|jgi:hypothetical protein